MAVRYYYEPDIASWSYDRKKVLHRENGPAVFSSHGLEEWWFHGNLHRIGGPAIKYNNGVQEWWVQGQLHRTDGPARITKKTKEYFQYGKRHRLDGPAIIGAKFQEYWINGQLIPKMAYMKHPDVKPNKLYKIKELTREAVSSINRYRSRFTKK